MAQFASQSAQSGVVEKQLSLGRVVALFEGATQVQGTINGYGERCGNANLVSIIGDLELKLDVRCVAEGELRKLSELSRLVAEVVNLAPDEHLPYVGRSAFAHKGGIHVSAMRRTSKSYQHVDPDLVGNEMRVVVSELSGRGNLLAKAEEYGLATAATGDVLDQIKALEAKGFSFEAAEASVAIMMKRKEPGYRAPFELVDFLVNVEHRAGRGIFAEAMHMVVPAKLGIYGVGSYEFDAFRRNPWELGGGASFYPYGNRQWRLNLHVKGHLPSDVTG